MRRDAARAVAQAAATQRTNAEAAKAVAEKKSADAAALAKTTTAARTPPQTAATDAAAKSHAADAEKAAADQRARQANEPRSHATTRWCIYSNPLVLEVDAAPLAMSIPAPPKPAKPGEKIEVPLQLERRFGFADVVYAGLVRRQMCPACMPANSPFQPVRRKGRWSSNSIRRSSRANTKQSFAPA